MVFELFTYHSCLYWHITTAHSQVHISWASTPMRTISPNRVANNWLIIFPICETFKITLAQTVNSYMEIFHTNLFYIKANSFLNIIKSSHYQNVTIGLPISTLSKQRTKSKRKGGGGLGRRVTPNLWPLQSKGQSHSEV